MTSIKLLVGISMLNIVLRFYLASQTLSRFLAERPDLFRQKNLVVLL
jgi:hypothetical protein